MKRILPVFLLLCSATAYAAEDAFPDVLIPYEQHTLPNGLTLIVHEDHKAPIVSASLWYHVGSKNEQRGKTGFAHLFEHLMLNGSKHYNDDFFRPLEQIGATDTNGTTSTDRTNYYATVPVPALDRLLWMLSDQMGYLLPAVNQARLDEQRGVVKNEKRQRENEPYGRMWEVLSAAAFPADHPYSWMPIGSMEDLDRASLADVQTWFRQWYGAANATLVIAGNITYQEARIKVEKYFGALAGGPPLVRAQQWVPKLDGEKRIVMQDRVPQTARLLAWNVPGTTAADTVLLSLVADVLGSGRNSRLYKRLVYRDRVATDASAWLRDQELAGQFGLWLRLVPGADADAAERAANEELAAFLKDGPTADELSRVKTVRYAEFVRALESVSSKAAVLAESQLYGGSPDAYRRDIALLRDATAEQLRNVARRWLVPERVVLTVVPQPELTKAVLDADRRKLPAVSDSPDVKLPLLQRATLPNGLKIVVAERRAAPVVQMNLMFNAGHAAGAGGKAGVPHFVATMLAEGTTTRDNFAIARREEELGADVSAGVNDDSSTVMLSAIRARLEPSVELFADIVRRPSFPKAELERTKPLRIAAITRLQASPNGIAGALLPQLIFGAQHPYNIQNSGLGNADAVRETTADDLRAFHARWYRPDNATLMVTGDTTLAEVQQLAEQYFGDWKAPAEPLPVKLLPTLPLPSKPRIVLVNRTGAEQSLIVAAQLSPPRADADHQAMVVVNNVLGGNFISRLNLNLREGKHWSYGVSSGRGVNVGQSLFRIVAPIETAQTAPALREIRREVTELLTLRPPKPDEVVMAKDSISKSLPGESETSAQLLGMLTHLQTYGLPDDYYDRYSETLKTIGPAQLASAAKELVNPQALTWLVVGDLSKIEAPIRALNWGEVQVLDATGQRLR